MNDEHDPDFVSDRPGEHMELEGGQLNTFSVGGRNFDVELTEESNGVWHASAEVHCNKNGHYYDANHAPYEVPVTEVEILAEHGPTPTEAFEALKSTIENGCNEDDSDKF